MILNYDYGKPRGPYFLLQDCFQFHGHYADYPDNTHLVQAFSFHVNHLGQLCTHW